MAVGCWGSRSSAGLFFRPSLANADHGGGGRRFLAAFRRKTRFAAPSGVPGTIDLTLAEGGSASCAWGSRSSALFIWVSRTQILTVDPGELHKVSDYRPQVNAAAFSRFRANSASTSSSAYCHRSQSAHVLALPESFGDVIVSLVICPFASSLNPCTGQIPQRRP